MVQNACTQDAFLQIRRYIHIVDNVRILTKDNPRWNALQKIQKASDVKQKTLGAAWILGERICVDKSMIKYMGRLYPLYSICLPSHSNTVSKYTLFVVPIPVIYTGLKFTPEKA